jgi:hypothetical protein
MALKFTQADADILNSMPLNLGSSVTSAESRRYRAVQNMLSDLRELAGTEDEYGFINQDVDADYMDILNSIMK